MFNLLLLRPIVVVIIFDNVSSILSHSCDSANARLAVKEGILGEAREFPWLAVLRVPVQQGDKTKVAATGAVLVTVNYVLVNAADVAALPTGLLRRNGKVYFITQPKKYITSKVKDYKVHPEYEFSTFNSLALLELNLEFDEESEETQHARGYLKPICWPGKAFNTSNALYVTGYTDERLLLEKVLYKAQYVPKDLCDEYYKRSSLKADKMQDPKQYVCGFAANNKNNCHWDNGMLLVSNVTGLWTLVGFGTAGPGCSAPARFVDISYYIDWIQSATTDPMFYDYYGGQ